MIEYGFISTWNCAVYRLLACAPTSSKVQQDVIRWVVTNLQPNPYQFSPTIVINDEAEI